MDASPAALHALAGRAMEEGDPRTGALSRSGTKRWTKRYRELLRSLLSASLSFFVGQLVRAHHDSHSEPRDWPAIYRNRIPRSRFLFHRPPRDSPRASVAPSFTRLPAQLFDAKDTLTPLLFFIYLKNYHPTVLSTSIFSQLTRVFIKY